MGDSVSTGGSISCQGSPSHVYFCGIDRVCGWSIRSLGYSVCSDWCSCRVARSTSNRVASLYLKLVLSIRIKARSPRILSQSVGISCEIIPRSSWHECILQLIVGDCAVSRVVGRQCSPFYLDWSGRNISCSNSDSSHGNRDSWWLESEGSWVGAGATLVSGCYLIVIGESILNSTGSIGVIMSVCSLGKEVTCHEYVRPCCRPFLILQQIVCCRCPARVSSAQCCPTELDIGASHFCDRWNRHLIRDCGKERIDIRRAGTLTYRIDGSHTIGIVSIASPSWCLSESIR